MRHKAENPENEVCARWMLFQLNRCCYAVPEMQVRKVVPVCEIAVVPGAPDYVLGIINLAGNFVPLIDLRKRLGLSPQAVHDSMRIVIVENSETVAGLLVDNEMEIIELSTSGRVPAHAKPLPAQHRFIKAAFGHGQHGLFLIDLNRLLSNHET